MGTIFLVFGVTQLGIKSLISKGQWDTELVSLLSVC